MEDLSIQLNENKDIIYSSFILHKNGITPIGTPTFEQWTGCGKFIHKAGSAIHFWLGDWLNYGEKKYGEMYTQAIEETGYDVGTLIHDKSVAGRIEIGRRRPALSFSHHAEVAKLEPEEQDRLLEKAEAEQISSKEFRELVKGKSKGLVPIPEPPKFTTEFCVNCLRWHFKPENPDKWTPNCLDK